MRGQSWFGHWTVISGGRRHECRESAVGQADDHVVEDPHGLFRQVEKDFEENGVAGEYVAEMERKEKHPDEPIFKIRIVPPISKKEKSRRRRRIAVNNFFMRNSRRLAACVTLLLMIAACLLMIRKNRKEENK